MSKESELEVLMTAQLQQMARFVIDRIPDDWAFCVLICETGVEPTSVLYVSNADRVDMTGIIESWLIDFKAGNYRLRDASEIEDSNA